MKDSLKTIWMTFTTYRWHISALIVFGIFSPLLEGIGVNAIVPLVSFFMGGGGTTGFINESVKLFFDLLHIPFTFRYLLGFIIVLFLLRAVSVIMFGYIRGWVNADFLSKESQSSMRSTLFSSWSFFLKQKFGTIHTSLIRDVQQTGALMGAIVQVIQSFSGCLMYLLVAISISPIITLYAVIGGALLLFVLRPFLYRIKKIGKETEGVEKQFSHFLSEHITGMKLIKASGSEKMAIDYGTSHIRVLRNLSIKQSLLNTVSTSFFQPAAILLVIILFLITYNTPEFNIISFSASLYLIQKIFVYLESGQNSIQSVGLLLPYARNLFILKRDLNTNRESSDGDKAFVFHKELTFKDVSFSYDGNKFVLNNINFSLRAGKAVGLIGPSGIGKTSIADLILRLFKPNTGSILLDNIPSESISLESWRQSIGYVPQDTFLINGTIEENIRFYNQKLKIEDIETAVKQANAHDFISKLPLGLKTNIGDRGVILSGGQKQRIALARALVTRPKILILDEATSALDHESEKMIQKTLIDLRGSTLVLVIAHKPSTIMWVDDLMVIGGGKIIEQGLPQELSKDENSYFSRMQKGE